MSLINAVKKGNVNTVKKLLNNGANVGQEDNEFGLTPLHWASHFGRANVVQVLLAAPGIDVNRADMFGRTPLYRASYKGHTVTVSLLLAAPGIDVNKADEDGWTPLSIASSEGHTLVVKALLRKRGIDVNKANKYGETPLYWASWKGHTEVAKALLNKRGIDVNKANGNGWTPLHVASFFGRTEVVKLFLAKGADPFKQIEDGKTALDLAQTEAIKKLLKKAMGIAIPWRNMNNEQRRGMKPILLKRMIAKGLKNGKNATFTEPIIYANYSYRTLKPVNNGKNITSLGLVIDDKNNVKAILDLEGATRAMRNVRERANREGKRVEQPLPGIIFKNWSLVNFIPNEYFNAMKDLTKLSVLRKGKRTRNNLESGRMNRIEANQKKTAEIANLRSTIRKASKRLNNLM